jgi:hypothetical protein
LASLIQILNMLVGFVLVFILPVLDLEFSAAYFSVVAYVNLAIIFGTPMATKIQKDVFVGNAYEHYPITMLGNIFIAALILGIFNKDQPFFIMVASVTIGLIFYLKSLLVAKQEIAASYNFNLARGLILPIGALICVNHVNNFDLFTLLLICSFTLLVAWQWRNLRYSRLPNFQEYLRISQSTFYLSGSSMLIWLFFQLPRINLFHLNSAEMVVLIQSMSVPLALLSIFEARGPYLFNKVLLAKSKPVFYSVFILILFYGSSFIIFNIALIFLKNYDHLTYINSEIAAVFFVLSFILSCHFEIVRRLLALTSEEKIFKLFIPSITLYGMFAFILLRYMENFSYWLLVLIFLVLYVPSMIFAYKKFPVLVNNS